WEGIKKNGHQELRGKFCLGVLRAVSRGSRKPAAVRRPPFVSNGFCECKRSAARSGAGCRGRGRHCDGETCPTLSRHLVARARTLRKTNRRLSRQRRVRHGQSCGQKRDLR